MYVFGQLFFALILAIVLAAWWINYDSNTGSGGQTK